MLDIKEKRHITVVGRGGGSAENVDWDDIQNKPEFATVATSGDYDDLTDKPNLATVATSGSYNDLSNTPSIPDDDIPEDKKNSVIIYNDSADMTFTQGVWSIGPIPTEIYQNGVKYTGTITSPYPLVTGKNVIIETLNGEPDLKMETFEFSNKAATLWIYANYKRNNHPISGAYTGDINVVLDKSSAAWSLSNCTGVKYWLLDNYGQFDITKVNTVVINDKSFKLTFSGTITSASDVKLTMYVPKTKYNDLVTLLQTTFSGVSDVTWFTDHIIQYDYMASDGYKLITIVNTGGSGSTDWDDITNKPNFSTVATSGSYNDLSNKPDLSHYVEDTDLASVATSGSYNDLTDKPTIPSLPNYDFETLSFTLSDLSVKTLDFFVLPDYFYIENLSNIGTATVSITKNSASAPTIEVFKSSDKINWESMGTTDTTAITATIPPQYKLYLKSVNYGWGKAWGSANRISVNLDYNIGGNIASLMYGDNFSSFEFNNWGNEWMFYQLFYKDTHLISAGNLTIPQIATLSNQALSQMFYQCTSLTTAPKYIHCYNPGVNAFNSMFNGCTSLTTAPHLIIDSTYYGGSIGTNSMYNGCTSLNKVVATINYENDKNNFGDWLDNCAATGDLYTLGSYTLTAPSGWTEHTSL